MEMLVVMMIIALAYGMMMPRLSFDNKQSLPPLIIILNEHYDIAQKEGTKILLFMDNEQLMSQQEGQTAQTILKRKTVETWLLNGVQPQAAQLVSILNPDGTMTPAVVQYQCGNRQYNITLTAFRGLHYQGSQSSAEEQSLCNMP